MLSMVPRSHICPSCLTELARIRAVPDPHYGLGVVVCPGCQLACVRARHPDREYWHRFQRTRSALIALFGRVLLTVLLGLLFWGLSEWAREIFANRHGQLNLIDPFTAFETRKAAGAWLTPIAGGVAGVIIRLLYLHHRAWIPGMTLFLVGAFFASLEYTFGWVINTIALVGRFEPPAEMETSTEIILRGQFYMMLWVFVLIGMMLGSLLGRSIASNDVRRYRRIRKKMRKRRMHGS